MSPGKRSRPGPPASSPKAPALPSLAQKNFELPTGYYELYGLRPPAEGAAQRSRGPGRPGWPPPPGRLEYYGIRTASVEGPIQAKHGGAGHEQQAAGTAVSQPVECPGQPLPEATRHKMERTLGADFTDVRVHEGDAADRMGALAFTQGSDVHFAPGQYSPGTPAGDQLLGHELWHVVQQRVGRVAAPQGKGAPIVEDEGLEAEADRMGAFAAEGREAPQASPSLGHATPGAPIQRQKKDAAAALGEVSSSA